MSEPRPETRQRVIDAASELFAERGFHGTKVRDIAARAEVNLASAHYHFGSKEELYVEVMRAQFGAVRDVLEARGALRPADQVARASRAELIAMLRARVAAMLELLLGPPPGLHGTLMLREMCDPSDALPVIVEQFIEPHKREMEELIARLAPELDAASVERAVYSVVGQVFFHRTHLPAVRLLRGGGDPTPRFLAELTEHITAFTLGGIEKLARAPRCAEKTRVRRGAQKSRAGLRSARRLRGRS